MGGPSRGTAAVATALRLVATLAVGRKPAAVGAAAGLLIVGVMAAEHGDFPTILTRFEAGASVPGVSAGAGATFFLAAAVSFFKAFFCTANFFFGTWGFGLQA